MSDYKAESLKVTTAMPGLQWSFSRKLRQSSVCVKHNRRVDGDMSGRRSRAGVSVMSSFVHVQSCRN